MKLTDILALAKPRAPADPAARPEDEAATIEAALDAIEAKRAEDQSRLATIGDERDALLLDPKSDAKIRALDDEADALRIGLERLDAAERALLARARAVASEVHYRSGAAIRVKYADAVDLFAQRLAAAADAREHLVTIRDEAAVAGIDEAMAFLQIPTIGLGITRQAARHFRDAAMQDLESWATREVNRAAPGSKKSKHVIEFTKATGGYNAGERAGFDPDTCHAFVGAGVARFVDPRRAPPAAAVKKV